MYLRNQAQHLASSYDKDRSSVNNQIDPKERYQAAVYTETGGCVCMARFEEPNEAQNWLMKQLETVKVEYPLLQRAWVIRDLQQSGKVLDTGGAAYLIKG